MFDPEKVVKCTARFVGACDGDSMWVEAVDYDQLLQLYRRQQERFDAVLLSQQAVRRKEGDTTGD